MSTIITRAGKGSILTNTEMDSNFTNLNADKKEAADITAAIAAARGVSIQAYDAQLVDIAGLTPTDNGVILGNGTNFVVESGAALKTSLGLTIGTDVQAHDANTAKLNVAQAFTAAQTFPAGHQVTGAVTSGYGTGSGGTVTQATSRTTGVTLDKPTGAITMFSAAGAASWSSFVVTNSLVAATDIVILSVKVGATNLYNVVPFNVTAGAFSVAFVSVFGTATDAPVINFAVIKGATS